jgi:hypothetical protein
MNEDSNAAPSSSSVKVSGAVLVNNPATKGTDIVREPTEIPATISAREPRGLAGFLIAEGPKTPRSTAARPPLAAEISK